MKVLTEDPPSQPGSRFREGEALPCPIAFSVLMGTQKLACSGVSLGKTPIEAEASVHTYTENSIAIRPAVHVPLTALVLPTPDVLMGLEIHSRGGAIVDSPARVSRFTLNRTI